jgi:tRNA modification GTPase
VSGELSTTLERFKKDLIRVIVVLESSLEFVEDDLPPAELTELLDVLLSTRKRISELAESFSAGRFLQDGLRVAIVGSPNVGKSSLFNRLSEQDRAIVTDIPGTTRDTLTHSIDVGGIPVLLIDTAGLRETNDSIETLGIARTLKAISDADVVLDVLDGSLPREPETFENNGTPSIRILNKADLPFNADYADEPDAIKVSALTGEGLDELRAAILKSVNHSDHQSDGLLITNVRHHDLLTGALHEIDSAAVLMKDRVSEELTLVPLHNALRYLDQITGETTTEDILSEVFATFCIGK